jgi:hypothetical protein
MTRLIHDVSKSAILSAGIVALFGVAAGCSKKKVAPKGDPIGMGLLLTPIKASAPTGLASASAASSLTESDDFVAAGSEIAEIKSRFFSAGPTDFMYRLKKVDERLAEIDTRHKSGARKCVTEAPKEWAITGLPDSSNTLTGTASFWFSCKEEITQSGGGTLTVLFGRKDGFSYLAQIQKSGDEVNPTMFVLGKVDDASTKSEVWQVNLTKPSVTDTAKQHSSWMYILGDKTNSNFEMAVGGSGRLNDDQSAEEPFSGVGCGVRLKANATLVYGTGVFHDAGTAGGNDATAQECGDAEVTVCAGASDLSTKTAADCSAITTFSTTVPKLTYTQLKGTAPYAGYVKAKAILDMTGLPTLTSFLEDMPKVEEGKDSEK